MMNLKKVIISSAVALSMMAIGGVAFAQLNSNPMSLAINGSGNVALSGTVSAVSASALSVNSWLGTWTVDNVTVANIKVGDTVKVTGTLGTGMTVNATTVKDVSVEKRTLAGTIGNLNATAGTFTLATENAGTVNVTTNANTQIKVNGSGSLFANLTAGAKATVSGSFNAAANTMTADTIRVPANQNDNNNENEKDNQGEHKGWLNINWGGWFKNWFKKD